MDNAESELENLNDGCEDGQSCDGNAVAVVNTVSGDVSRVNTI